MFELLLNPPRRLARTEATQRSVSATERTSLTNCVSRWTVLHHAFTAFAWVSLMLGSSCGLSPRPADAGFSDGPTDTEAEAVDTTPVVDTPDVGCTPASRARPVAEPCNGLDDDCDGLIDENDSTCHCGALGAPCGVGFECEADRCYSADRQQVYVPGDTFWMGCNKVLDPICAGESCLYSNYSNEGGEILCAVGVASDEIPQVRRELLSFAIDRYPATVLDYLSCVQSGACAEGQPEHRMCASLFCPRVDDVPQDKEELRRAMTAISWTEAETYCRWRNGRLCSEAEWEMAARGGCTLHCDRGSSDECCRAAMPTFPWGEAVPTCSVHPYSSYRFCSCGGGGGLFEPSFAVDAYPEGASVYGVEDMVGNTGQWVADPCFACFDESAALTPRDCDARVLRGIDFLVGGIEPCDVDGYCGMCGMSIDACNFDYILTAPGFGVHRAGGRMSSHGGIGAPWTGTRCCYDVGPN